MNTYTVDEVASILRVSPATVRKLIHSQKLEAVEVGNQYRITQEALDRFLKSRT